MRSDAKIGLPQAGILEEVKEMGKKGHNGGSGVRVASGEVEMEHSLHRGNREDGSGVDMRDRAEENVGMVKTR